MSEVAWTVVLVILLIGVGFLFGLAINIDSKDKTITYACNNYLVKGRDAGTMILNSPIYVYAISNDSGFSDQCYKKWCQSEYDGVTLKSFCNKI